MHDTALRTGKLFLETYAGSGSIVVDIGAMDVNGSLREYCPSGATYIGFDMSAGRGVDVIVAPGQLPLPSNRIDIVLASSALEHDPFFWETFLEMARVIKAGGAIYINAPSNGPYHRYPTDNWRFYPDCGKALQGWAVKNGLPIRLIESFIAEKGDAPWNDFVAVFEKTEAPDLAARRYLSDNVPCTNVWLAGGENVMKYRRATEDMKTIKDARAREEKIKELETRIAALTSGTKRPIEGQ